MDFQGFLNLFKSFEKKHRSKILGSIKRYFSKFQRPLPFTNSSQLFHHIQIFGSSFFFQDIIKVTFPATQIFKIKFQKDLKYLFVFYFSRQSLSIKLTMSKHSAAFHYLRLPPFPSQHKNSNPLKTRFIANKVVLSLLLCSFSRFTAELSSVTQR